MSPPLPARPTGPPGYWPAAPPMPSHAAGELRSRREAMVGGVQGLLPGGTTRAGTASASASASSATTSSTPTEQYFANGSAARVSTDLFMTSRIRARHPGLQLVIAPEYTCDLLGFAAAGHAEYSFVADDVAAGDVAEKSINPTTSSSSSTTPLGTADSPHMWTSYLPAARRLDGGAGALASRLIFGKLLYRWQGSEFVVYVVEGRDGAMGYPMVLNYILSADANHASALLAAVGRWVLDLHDEVWVFDQGMWAKSRELFESVRKSSWDAVILDPDMKRAVIDDHLGFFAARATYDRLKVPWKRGVIYHGPPGNGKTISIKATMRMLNELPDPVPTLYVRTLASYMGPEYSIKMIFAKARQMAPCYLVFEDLDTIVSDNVRSYFLNEVDGLKANDGIFMVGSTNHLDRLDPGISKRPSRFDRKYFFPDPDTSQRVLYCQFWQRKLASNADVEFPDELCDAVAGITDGFSFAYMQEAFVAALLAIARGGTVDFGAAPEEPDDWVDVAAAADGAKGAERRADKDIDDLLLWVEIQKQVAILREGMDNEGT